MTPPPPLPFLVILNELFGVELSGCNIEIFFRVLTDMLRYHKPDVLGLLEPKVSGSQADDICEKLGLRNWIRVESVGFNGGIYMGLLAE